MQHVHAVKLTSSFHLVSAFKHTCAHTRCERAFSGKACSPSSRFDLMSVFNRLVPVQSAESPSVPQSKPLSVIWLFFGTVCVCVCLHLSLLPLTKNKRPTDRDCQKKIRAVELNEYKLHYTPKGCGWIHNVVAPKPIKGVTDKNLKKTNNNNKKTFLKAQMKVQIIPKKHILNIYCGEKMM